MLIFTLQISLQMLHSCDESVTTQKPFLQEMQINVSSSIEGFSVHLMNRNIRWLKLYLTLLPKGLIDQNPCYDDFLFLMCTVWVY